MPKYFDLAAEIIKCDCKLCRCPSANRETARCSYVYVNEKYKYMYVSMPKVASKSIRALLFDRNKKYSMIDNQQPVEDYFKFTFVRNPWDRLVSCWKMFTDKTNSKRNEQMVDMFGKVDIPFNEFVNLFQKVPNHHWQPQVLFLAETMDYIGRYENLVDDFNAIAPKIGVSKDSLPHLNKVEGKHYKEYYNSDSIKTVEAYYKQDIERFGYEF